jgi:hypothetical protein
LDILSTYEDKFSTGRDIIHIIIQAIIVVFEFMNLETDILAQIVLK